MEYFTILQTPVDEWQTIKEAPPAIRAEVIEKCNGFITEVNAGHKGKRLFAIWINPERTEAQQLHTIGHELAHLDRLHLDRLHLDRAEVEQNEAEARAAAASYAERYARGDFDAWKVDSSRLH